MKDVDYNIWSEYIKKIADIHLKGIERVLELASGNCSIGKILSSKFRTFIASDISFSMLKSSDSPDVTKICCDMTSLPFKTKFDFIFSAFDSINYISNRKKLFKFFIDINNLLNDGCIFTFDASMESNSLNYTVPKNTSYRFNDYSFRKVSRYKKLKKTHYNLFVIDHISGTEYKELHKQKIYNFETYFKLAEKAGLKMQAYYNYFTFEQAGPESERVQFVMRKTKV